MLDLTVNIGRCSVEPCPKPFVLKTNTSSLCRGLVKHLYSGILNGFACTQF